MSRHAFDQPTTVASPSPDRFARLRLRDELYLIAHNDDSGTPHTNVQALEIGLAGAILIDLWSARRVAIGWTRDNRQQWVQVDGGLAVYGDAPVDDLGNAAIAAIRQIRSAVEPPEQLRQWLRAFAGTDLYLRVQGAMTAAGVLRPTDQRGRHVWLSRQQAWPVRARAGIREVLDGYAQPKRPAPTGADPQCGALCGLVLALDLIEFLYLPSSMPKRKADRWLRQILGEQDFAIRQVAAAVDQGRGDLAVAAMR